MRLSYIYFGMIILYGLISLESSTYQRYSSTFVTKASGFTLHYIITSRVEIVSDLPLHEYLRA